MIKTNKGVTMIMLVITIVIMLILTSFAVYYSTNIAPEARIAAAFSSLKEVKTACQRAMNEIELDSENLDEYYFFGKNIYKEGENCQFLLSKCGIDSIEGTYEEYCQRIYHISGSSNPEMKRRVEKLEITGLGSYEFLVDLERDKYYLLGGTGRNWYDEVYEYSDIERLYSMLTSTND
jgi:Tfp pilus assembly protein PilE